MEGSKKRKVGVVEKVPCECRPGCLVHPETRRLHLRKGALHSLTFKMVLALVTDFSIKLLARKKLHEDVQKSLESYEDDFQPASTQPSPSPEPATSSDATPSDTPHLLQENNRLRNLLQTFSRLFPEDDSDSKEDSDSEDEKDERNEDDHDHACDDDKEEEEEEESENEDEEDEEGERALPEGQNGRRRFPAGSEQAPLFQDAKVSVLATLLLLFQWKHDNLISDKALSALLLLLGCILLPDNNQLPRSRYLCEGILESQSPAMKRDVCINECHLFVDGEEVCPDCDEARSEFPI